MLEVRRVGRLPAASCTLKSQQRGLPLPSCSESPAYFICLYTNESLGNSRASPAWFADEMRTVIRCLQHCNCWVGEGDRLCR